MDSVREFSVPLRISTENHECCRQEFDEFFRPDNCFFFFLVSMELVNSFMWSWNLQMNNVRITCFGVAAHPINKKWILRTRCIIYMHWPWYHSWGSSTDQTLKNLESSDMFPVFEGLAMIQTQRMRISCAMVLINYKELF